MRYFARKGLLAASVGSDMELRGSRFDELVQCEEDLFGDGTHWCSFSQNAEHLVCIINYNGRFTVSECF